MIVVVTNITDVPGDRGASPTEVEVYNKRLAPGGTLRLPAELVNKRVRDLEKQGLVAIGAVPPWYVRAKTRGGSRALTAEEKAKRNVTPPPPPAPPAKVLLLEDVVPAVIEGDEFELKASKKQKKG
jgi:hypothetical protein